MKKSTGITIAVLVFLAFIGLVVVGFKKATPSGDPLERLHLPVPLIDAMVDLENGISADVWSTLPGLEIELFHQVMVLPYTKHVMGPLDVKAFHNGDDIYFYFRWEDDTENREKEVGIFPDSTAVMFPADEGEQPSTMMMGFMGNANIWQWKGNFDGEYWLGEDRDNEAYVDYHYEFEDQETLPVSQVEVFPGARDLLAMGPGSLTVKEEQIVMGRGIWEDGTWQVVVRRSLLSQGTEFGASFPGGEQLAAFGIWNGANGDRGGKKSISDWVVLEVE